MTLHGRSRSGQRRLSFLGLPILAIAAVALAAGCSSGSPASGGSNSNPQIVIGGIFELSGPDAVFGQGNYQGAKLAVQKIDAAGGINGKPVKMIVSDDQSDPATAVAAVRRDVSSDHVSIVLGPVFSPVALAVAQAAQALKVVFYTPGSAAPQNHPSPTRSTSLPRNRSGRRICGYRGASALHGAQENRIPGGD